MKKLPKIISKCIRDENDSDGFDIREEATISVIPAGKAQNCFGEVWRSERTVERTRASFPDFLDEARIISGARGNRALIPRLLSTSPSLGTDHISVQGKRHTHTTTEPASARVFARLFATPTRRHRAAFLGTLHRRLIDAGWRTKMADLLHFQSRVFPRVPRRQQSG